MMPKRLGSLRPMADPRKELASGTLALSLLDRLVDRDADLEADPPRTRGEQIADIREGLRRDLEILLNTRCRPVTPPKSLDGLEGSLLTFGVPGFFGSSLVTDTQRAALAQDLENRIQIYEPRLDELRVTIRDAASSAQRTLRLQIRAVYRLQEGMPELNYETRLDPVTQRFSVQEAGRG